MSFVAAFDKRIFYNEATHYAVLQMKTADIMVPQEARSPYKYRDHLIRFLAHSRYGEILKHFSGHAGKLNAIGIEAQLCAALFGRLLHAGDFINPAQHGCVERASGTIANDHAASIGLEPPGKRRYKGGVRRGRLLGPLAHDQVNLEQHGLPLLNIQLKLYKPCSNSSAPSHLFWVSPKIKIFLVPQNKSKYLTALGIFSAC